MENKKSLWGGIKNMIFEEEPPKEEVQAPVATSSVAPVYPIPTPYISTPNVYVTPTAPVVDPAYLQHFEETFAKSNIPGPDYFEYSKSLLATSSMANQIPEKARYEMAFQFLRTNDQNLDWPYLKETGMKYLDIMNNELSEFNASIEAEKQKEIGSRQELISKLNAENEAKVQEIEKLSKEIAENQNRATEINAEIVEQSTDLDQKLKNFEFAHLSFCNRIKEELQKIETYLKDITKL